jgi:hypothetical protein
VNFFSGFNTLTLTPFTNGNTGGPVQIVDANPENLIDAALRAASNFGRPTVVDAGQQLMPA